MLVKVFGSAVLGVEASTVIIEVNATRGVGYHLVGLPGNAIKESSYRVFAALRNTGYEYPVRKIIINMAPADVRKEGSAYDLSFAVGILAATGQIPADNIDKYIIMGELSLDGSLQPIKGALPIALQAQKEGFKGFILPYQNAQEAAIVKDLEVYGVHNITEVLNHFKDGSTLEKTQVNVRDLFYSQLDNAELDFSDVKGQESIKRCLEIAAAGGHNVILIGPPGSGKTMLAKRLPGILPPMTLYEALETTKIHSVTGQLKEHNGLVAHRPFRSPHHTISDIALVGGGSFPQPGEMSLSHNGVLFLDELPEFKRKVLEVMRQPLEDREVTLSRSQYKVTYPASFMLVASMNPSPNGFFNDPGSPLNNTPHEMQRYLGKISGPLLDRIDIHVEVNPVPFEKLNDIAPGETTATIRKRVIKAREIQTARFMDLNGVHYNSQMRSPHLQKYCRLKDDAIEILKMAMDRLGLSARAYGRILKVSRTIADLEGSPEIEVDHLREAIQYRSLDREGWLGHC